jgi:hypothetical protein
MRADSRDDFRLIIAWCFASGVLVKKHSSYTGTPPFLGPFGSVTGACIIPLYENKMEF